MSALYTPEICLLADNFALVTAESLRRRMHNAGLLNMHQDCMLSWRIKSEESIKVKEAWAHRNKQPAFINDYIGLRLLMLHSGLLSSALQQVKLWALDCYLVEQQTEDKYLHTGLGGYRALHLDYLPSDPNPFSLPNQVSVEVQITTVMQGVHGDLCHKLIYKPVEEPSLELIGRLKTIGDLIGEADRLIADLSRPVMMPR